MKLQDTSFSEEWIKKRKTLNFTKEQLEKKTLRQLRLVCNSYGLSQTGDKKTLISSILNAKENDQYYLSQKRASEDRELETQLMKKQKLQTEGEIVMCNVHIPNHIFFHIIKFVALQGNKTLLDTAGLVNSQWYINIRSPEMWKCISLSPKYLEFIPLPMLKACKKLYLKNEFSFEDFQYLLSKAENLENIDAIYCFKDWKAFETMINMLDAQKIQVLKASCRDYPTNLQYMNLKFINTISNFKRLRWLELKRWSPSPEMKKYTKILSPVLQNCKELKGLAIPYDMVDSFQDISEPLLNLKYLDARRPTTMEVINKISPDVVSICPKLKVLHIFVCPNTLKQFQDLEELEIEAYYGIPKYFPPKLRIFSGEGSVESWHGDPVKSVTQLTIDAFDTITLTTIVNRFPNVQILELFPSKILDDYSPLTKLQDLRALYCRPAVDHLYKFVHKIKKLQFVEGSKKFNKPFTVPPVIQKP